MAELREGAGRLLARLRRMAGCAIPASSAGHCWRLRRFAFERRLSHPAHHRCCLLEYLDRQERA
jgi:hypothetical protein